MSGQTTIPTIAGNQFAARLADNFPRGWAGDDAKQFGNVYAFLLSVGAELSAVQIEVQYAADAQRIQTETSPELDDASLDFLGTTYPRPNGASDAVFAEGIIAKLFQPAVTRQAIYGALAALTGYAPRMLEPWNVLDTGVWGFRSYWNVDTVANPARWGNGGLRYQGYIETAPPAIPAIGPNNPILGWGTVAYWNVPGYFFGIIDSVAIDAVDALINQIRAYGTVIWLKLVPPGNIATAIPPGVVGALTARPAGPTSITVAWTSP